MSNETAKRPRVSIGMPVRNGQRFMGQAIESILNQTFTDLELIICDNASTDSTEEICRGYAEKDARVKYIRNPKDVGPAENHNIGFRAARGEYFKWAAHDDMCLPMHIEKCVELLDQDPTVVLAYPKTLYVDENNKPLHEYTFKPGTDHSDVVTRFASLVLVNHRHHGACEIFGLMRASALATTPLEGAYARGDSVLLVRMALRGRCVELEDRLFWNRWHSSQSMQSLPAHLKNSKSKLWKVLGTGPMPPPEWWDSRLKGKVTWPEWNLLKEYLTSIHDAPIKTSEKVRCYGVMAWWTIKNAPKLFRDVAFAGERIFYRLLEAMKSSDPGAGATVSSGSTMTTPVGVKS